MIRQYAHGLGPVFGWLIFPMIPALLGRTYHEAFNLAFFQASGPDPRDWGWFAWVLLAGPLVGYGFLAGATLRLADDPDRRGLRRILSLRSAWVAIGPWAGFVVLGGLYLLLVCANSAWEWLMPADNDRPPFLSLAGMDSGVRLVLFVAAVAVLAYGWLPLAVAALRQARGGGRLRQCLERGLAGAVAFIGSLFGSFWAITEVWRSYFFDSRVVPLLAAVTSLALLSGCDSSITYGEMRRRDLFSAMLSAWLLGLALVWRWWSRPRSRP